MFSKPALPQTRPDEGNESGISLQDRLLQPPAPLGVAEGRPLLTQGSHCVSPPSPRGHESEEFDPSNTIDGVAAVLSSENESISSSPRCDKGNGALSSLPGREIMEGVVAHPPRGRDNVGGSTPSSSSIYSKPATSAKPKLPVTSSSPSSPQKPAPPAFQSISAEPAKPSGILMASNNASECAINLTTTGNDSFSG